MAKLITEPLVEPLTAESAAQYAIEWSGHGGKDYGYGISTPVGAKRWFNWMAEQQFRYGVPKLLVQKDGIWEEVPLENN